MENLLPMFVVVNPFHFLFFLPLFIGQWLGIWKSSVKTLGTFTWKIGGVQWTKKDGARYTWSRYGYTALIPTIHFKRKSKNHHNKPL